MIRPNDNGKYILELEIDGVVTDSVMVTYSTYRSKLAILRSLGKKQKLEWAIFFRKRWKYAPPKRLRKFTQELSMQL